MEWANCWVEISKKRKMVEWCTVLYYGAKKEFSGPQFAQTLGAVFFNKHHYEVNFLKKSQNLRKNSIFQRFSSWLDQYI